MTAQVTKGGERSPKSGSPHLRVVSKTHRVVDISALLRADIPGPDHWADTHTRGDRSQPVDLPPRRKWGWSGK